MKAIVSAISIARVVADPGSVEKVARVLCQEDERDGGAPWDWYKDSGQNQYRERALDVLTAIAEMADQS